MKKDYSKISRILKELIILPFVADITTAINFYLAILTSIPSIIKDGNLIEPHKKCGVKNAFLKYSAKKLFLTEKLSAMLEKYM